MGKVPGDAEHVLVHLSLGKRPVLSTSGSGQDCEDALLRDDARSSASAILLLGSSAVHSTTAPAREDTSALVARVRGGRSGNPLLIDIVMRLQTFGSVNRMGLTLVRRGTLVIFFPLPDSSLFMTMLGWSWAMDEQVSTHFACTFDDAFLCLNFFKEYPRFSEARACSRI